MKQYFLVFLLGLGLHGMRHTISHHYLNWKAYRAKKKEREEKLVEWMKTNGIGSE